jgi:Ca2+-binding RTX toxin-like protein
VGGSSTFQDVTYDGGGDITFDFTSSPLAVDYVLLQQSPGQSNLTWKIEGLSLEFTTILNPADDLLNFALTGQDGDADSASDDFTVNVMAGTGAPDTIVTGSTDDQVSGGAGNDTINAGAGNDVIIGGAGADNLTGGPGNDKFVLQGSGGGLDTIVDFASADDILVDIASQSLTIGTAVGIAANEFGIGNDPTAGAGSFGAGSTTRFYFEQDTNTLWHSADGSVAAAIQLAQIGTGIDVQQADMKVF